jgi:hypothetical protein
LGAPLFASRNAALVTVSKFAADHIFLSHNTLTVGALLAGQSVRVGVNSLPQAWQVGVPRAGPRAAAARRPLLFADSTFLAQISEQKM